MLIYPTSQIIKRDVIPLGNGVNTAAAGTAITPSATSNTKGSYAQLIASLAAPARQAFVQILLNPAQAAPGKGWLVDIARSSTITVTIASPGVVTWANHGLEDQAPISFTTTSALPTGITAGTTYYVKYVDQNSFQISATPGGAAINTTGSQSGTHTGYFDIIPNLCVDVAAQFGQASWNAMLPISIAAGVRIAARCQTNISSSTDTVLVKLITFAQGFTARGIECLNPGLSTGYGTAITPGNGSKSSYVQILAATARKYKGVFYWIDHQGINAANFPLLRIDLAFGGSGSEIIHVPDWIIYDQGSTFQNKLVAFMPYDLALGTRLAARAQADGTPNNIGVTAYGVY